MVWVEGDNSSTTQTSTKQDGLSEPQRAGTLGVTLKDSGSKLERVQSRGGTLLAKEATLGVKSTGKGLAGGEVATAKAAVLGTEGAGVKHPRLWR